MVVHHRGPTLFLFALIFTYASGVYLEKSNFSSKKLNVNVGAFQSRNFEHTKLENGVEINYKGGPILYSPINLYFIWYGKWDKSLVPGLIKKFVSSITKDSTKSPAINSVKSWWATNTLYTDSQGRNVTNKVSLKKEYLSNYPLGKSLTFDIINMEDIILDAIKNGLPKEKNAVYAIFTSEDVVVQNSISDIGFCTDYCGFHYKIALNISNSFVNVPYIFIGDPSSQCSDLCLDFVDSGFIFPNNKIADSLTNTFAVLLSGTSTNPGPKQGWITEGGSEPINICTANFDKTLYDKKNGKTYPYTLEGSDRTRFYIQSNYNPIINQCVLQTTPASPTPPPKKSLPPKVSSPSPKIKSPPPMIRSPPNLRSPPPSPRTSPLPPRTSPPPPRTSPPPPRTFPPPPRMSPPTPRMSPPPPRMSPPPPRMSSPPNLPPGPPTIGIFFEGGRVLTETINLYVIWYGNWKAIDQLILKDLISSFTYETNNGLTGSVNYWWKINTLYYDDLGVPVSENVNIKQEITTKNLGNVISDAKLMIPSIIEKMIEQGLNVDKNGIYVIFTSEEIKVFDTFKSGGFCKDYPGYHGVKLLNATFSVPFIFVGNPNTQCPQKYTSILEATANGNVGIDSMINTFSALLSQTATSVDAGTGWINPQGLENAQLCANKFGRIFTADNEFGEQYQYNLVGKNDRRFFIQQNYDPIKGMCTLQAY